MEIEGHPTQDMIEELERRGALRADGGSSGPRIDAIRFITQSAGDVSGFWLFVSQDTFRTGVDEVPG